MSRRANRKRFNERDFCSNERKNRFPFQSFLGAKFPRKRAERWMSGGRERLVPESLFQTTVQGSENSARWIGKKKKTAVAEDVVEACEVTGRSRSLQRTNGALLYKDKQLTADPHSCRLWPIRTVHLLTRFIFTYLAMYAVIPNFNFSFPFLFSIETSFSNISTINFKSCPVLYYSLTKYHFLALAKVVKSLRPYKYKKRKEFFRLIPFIC